MEADLDQRLKRIEEALALLRHPLPPPLLRVSEVAKLLGVSRAYVRRLIDGGKLRAVKLECRRSAPIYRIPQDAYAEYVQSLEMKTSPPKQGRLIVIPDIKV